MHEPIEQSGDEHLVAENLAPFDECLIAGKDDGAFFIAPDDQLEDQIDFVSIQRQVADFIYDKQRGFEIGFSFLVSGLSLSSRSCLTSRSEDQVFLSLDKAQRGQFVYVYFFNRRLEREVKAVQGAQAGKRASLSVVLWLASLSKRALVGGQRPFLDRDVKSRMGP